MFKAIFAIVAVLISVLFMQSGLLEELIPADINARSMAYVHADPNQYGRIISLADAKRLKVDIIIAHRNNQLAYSRATQDDNLQYGDAYGMIDATVTNGNALMATLVGDEQHPVSLSGILALAGMGGAGVVVGGKYIKRKQDFTPEQYALAANGNGGSGANNINKTATAPVAPSNVTG